MLHLSSRRQQSRVFYALPRQKFRNFVIILRIYALFFLQAPKKGVKVPAPAKKKTVLILFTPPFSPEAI